MKNKCNYSVENVRKGEIACYKQFLPISECFLQYVSFVRQNAVLCGNRFNAVMPLFQLRIFTEYQPSGAKCWHVVLLTTSPFPIMFSIQSKTEIIILAIFHVILKYFDFG